MPIIKVQNLSKKYKNIVAIDDISFEVAEGEIFAFLGPNGAGKSTTIKILTTLLQPTSGQILVAGANPSTEKDKVRHAIGIVFQDQSLDEELTAYENMNFHGILYGLSGKLRKERIEELLKIVELWDRRNSLVKTFSGGMKRRLEIARGLMHHPKIIFLDEPTLGLDPQTRNLIWAYIKNLNTKEKITIFFTTHYLDEADRTASRIAIVDHGKIKALGTPQELKIKTKKNSLEEAFLAITGEAIREEEATNIDRMRLRHRGHR